jgi:hypothetical protein
MAWISIRGQEPSISRSTSGSRCFDSSGGDWMRAGYSGRRIRQEFTLERVNDEGRYMVGIVGTIDEEVPTFHRCVDERPMHLPRLVRVGEPERRSAHLVSSTTKGNWLSPVPPERSRERRRPTGTSRSPRRSDTAVTIPRTAWTAPFTLRARTGRRRWPRAPGSAPRVVATRLVGSAVGLCSSACRGCFDLWSWSGCLLSRFGADSSCMTPRSL